jgi:hypothetical protein
VNGTTMRIIGAALFPLGLMAMVPAGCASAAAPTTTTAVTKTVSLRNDVLHIFAANCSTSATCHGSPNGIEVFLAGGAAKATAIRSGIVNVATAELTSMPYVKVDADGRAGDPTNSYLMHKLDGDQGTFDAQCVAGSCGAQMPRDATPLDAATRDTIRTWITQGAPDN